MDKQGKQRPSGWARAGHLLAALGTFLAACDDPSSEVPTDGASEATPAPLLEGRAVTDREFLNINGVANLPGDGFTGRRRGAFRLPAGDVVVGSGPESLYIARMDPQGFQRLLVHPWPPW